MPNSVSDLPFAVLISYEFVFLLLHQGFPLALSERHSNPLDLTQPAELEIAVLRRKTHCCTLLASSKYKEQPLLARKGLFTSILSAVAFLKHHNGIF